MGPLPRHKRPGKEGLPAMIMAICQGERGQKRSEKNCRIIALEVVMDVALLVR